MSIVNFSSRVHAAMQDITLGNSFTRMCSFAPLLFLLVLDWVMKVGVRHSMDLSDGHLKLRLFRSQDQLLFSVTFTRLGR